MQKINIQDTIKDWLKDSYGKERGRSYQQVVDTYFRLFCSDYISAQLLTSLLIDLKEEFKNDTSF